MKFKPIPPKGLKTYSIRQRKSKVSVGDFATPARKGALFSEFLSSLPNILAGKGPLEGRSKGVHAHRDGKPVALGMGAHVIKVGLSPLIIDLMERGVVTSIEATSRRSFAA